MSSSPFIPTPSDVIQNIEEASYHGLPARRAGNRNDYDSGFSELAPPSVQADSCQYWESETSFSPSPRLSREEVNQIMSGRGNFEEVSVRIPFAFADFLISYLSRLPARIMSMTCTMVIG